MSVEIEAKMRLTDGAGLESRLVAAGAVRGPVIDETNTFFDTPQNTFKSTDQGLRVRVERGGDGRQTVTITHKGPRAHGKLKSRQETEMVVSDAHAAGDLLGALGFVPVLAFDKRRRKWNLDGCEVVIDRLPYIGDFVEIEGPSDDAVLEVRRKLGLEAVPLLRASYITLLLQYLHEHRMHVHHVELEPDAA